MPDIKFDHAIAMRPEESDTTALLVVEDVGRRAVLAWAAPRKGVTDADTVERVYRGVCETGVRPPCIRKCDTASSIKALREEFMRRVGPGVVPQEPPVGEPQSSGAVENAVKLLTGMIRVHVLALERKLWVMIRIGHVVLPWIVEAVCRT